MVRSNFVQTVLLIDDDPSCSFILGEFIQLVDERINKISAFSVEESLQVLAVQKPFPEIIFVDLNMPIKSGFDFLESYENLYYSIYPNTKVIVLTSSLRPADRERTLAFKCVTAFESKSEIHNFIDKTLLVA